MYKIIDIHSHVYPEAISDKAVKSLAAFYEFTVEGKGTYTDLETKSKAAGVSGFLMLAVATNAHQVTRVNDSIAAQAEISRQRGFETYGFAGIHQDFEDFAGEIDRIEKLGMKGVKIHPDIQRWDLEDKRMYELCEILEGRMPLYLHMGDNRPQYRYSEPKKLAKLLDRFPRLVVGAAHFGGYKDWDEAENVLAGRPNVWYDTSSALWAMTPERAKELITAYGADRVMFGTDYPVKNPDEEIGRFMKIDLTEKEREDIFYNNAKRFLGI